MRGKTIMKQSVPHARFKKVLKAMLFSTAAFLAVIIFIASCPPLYVRAAGWVEEVREVVANYTKYPLDNYSLDFYADSGGMFAKVAYQALYLLTNVLWILSAAFSYLIGFIVEQAYNLDFISDAISYLSGNIQTIAGVDESGFRSHGLLPSFLPIFIVIAGGYFIYMGVVKRQVTKAVSFLVTFLVLTIAGMGFIAYSDSYLTMMNDFQKDFNQEVLTIGSSLLTGEEEQSEDPVVGIRSSLFDIQVIKPYLLLQYGESSIEEIGEDRVDELLSTAPGDDREKIVKEEVQDQENTNMGVELVAKRLGMTLLILIVNLVISFCMAIFCGVMIVAEVMFILYSAFLPVGLVFSLLPGRQKTVMKVLAKTMNTLLNKAGITLIITITFSISSLCYSLSAEGNFFWMMFLQVVVFVSAMMKRNELLGFMNLGGDETKQVSSAFGRLMSGAVGFALGRGTRKMGKSNASDNMGGAGASRNNRNRSVKTNKSREEQRNKSKAMRAGEAIGAIKDMPNTLKDKMKRTGEGIKDMPMNAKASAKRAKQEYSHGRDVKQATNQDKRVDGARDRERSRQQKRDFNAGYMNYYEMDNSTSKAKNNEVSKSDLARKHVPKRTITPGAMPLATNPKENDFRNDRPNPVAASGKATVTMGKATTVTGNSTTTVEKSTVERGRNVKTHQKGTMQVRRNRVPKSKNKQKE